MKTVTAFVSEDNKSFASAAECKAYEARKTAVAMLETQTRVKLRQSTLDDLFSHAHDIYFVLGKYLAAKKCE